MCPLNNIHFFPGKNLAANKIHPSLPTETEALSAKAKVAPFCAASVTFNSMPSCQTWISIPSASRDQKTTVTDGPLSLIWRIIPPVR